MAAPLEAFGFFHTINQSWMGWDGVGYVGWDGMGGMDEMEYDEVGWMELDGMRCGMGGWVGWME